MTRPSRPACTGAWLDGTPCPNRAQPGTDPPRCGRHPSTGSSTVARQAQRARQDAFLQAFGLVGNITDAAQAAGVSRSAHYDWLNDADEPLAADYRHRFAAATLEANDRLTREARRRAVDGVLEPVYYQGEIAGHVKRYSDGLLQFLMRGAMPDLYAPAQARVTAQAGDTGPAVTVTFPIPDPATAGDGVTIVGEDDLANLGEPAADAG